MALSKAIEGASRGGLLPRLWRWSGFGKGGPANTALFQLADLAATEEEAIHRRCWTSNWQGNSACG